MGLQNNILKNKKFGSIDQNKSILELYFDILMIYTFIFYFGHKFTYVKKIKWLI